MECSQWILVSAKTATSYFPSIVLGFVAFLMFYLFLRFKLFHNFRADPSSELSAIFSTIGLSQSHVPLALKALNEDSQKGTFGKMGTQAIKLEEPGAWIESDEIFTSYGSKIRSDTTRDQMAKFLKGE